MMTITSPPVNHDRHLSDSEGKFAVLRHAIDHAAHFLPAQGPINVFIHHNTLHALEELQFDDAVVTGGKIFGCQPYLPEDRYREKLSQGRISLADLRASIEADLTSPDQELIAGGLVNLLELRLAMLNHPLRVAPAPELRWFIAETDALTRFRSDVPPEDRDRWLREARHWVMRDLCGTADEGTLKPKLNGHEADTFSRLFEQFPAAVERWTNRNWESFTLQALWRVCRQGVHGLPAAHHEHEASTQPGRVPAICCWRPPAPTAICWCMRCSFGTARRFSIKAYRTGCSRAAAKDSSNRS